MSTLSGSHGLSGGRARRTKSKVRSIPDIFLSPQTHLSNPFFFKQIAEEKTDFATKLRKLGQNMKRYMWHGDLLCITQMMDVEEKCQISPHQSCNQRNQINLSYRDIWNFSAWQIFSTGTTWQISGMARPTSVPLQKICKRHSRAIC